MKFKTLFQSKILTVKGVISLLKKDSKVIVCDLFELCS